MIIDGMKWHIDKSTGYLCTFIKKKKLYYHRYIMNAQKGDIVDHINRNKLDNRLENLRVVSRMGNAINRSKQKNNKSGYTGVCWSKHIKRWRATITVNKKQLDLGTYKNIEDAVEAYRRAEEIYFKDLRQVKN